MNENFFTKTDTLDNNQVSQGTVIQQEDTSIDESPSTELTKSTATPTPREENVLVSEFLINCISLRFFKDSDSKFYYNMNPEVELPLMGSLYSYLSMRLINEKFSSYFVSNYKEFLFNKGPQFFPFSYSGDLSEVNTLEIFDSLENLQNFMNSSKKGKISKALNRVFPNQRLISGDFMLFYRNFIYPILLRIFMEDLTGKELEGNFGLFLSDLEAKSSLRKESPFNYKVELQGSTKDKVYTGEGKPVGRTKFKYSSKIFTDCEIGYTEIQEPDKVRLVFRLTDGNALSEFFEVDFSKEALTLLSEARAVMGQGELNKGFLKKLEKEVSLMSEIRSLIKYFKFTNRSGEIPVLEEALSILEDKASHKVELFLRGRD